MSACWNCDHSYWPLWCAASASANARISHAVSKATSPRHQPVGGLVADDAAERRRHPDGSALVAAEREVDLAGGDQCGATAGAAAGGPRGIPRIAHRPGHRGVAAAREAQVLADRLPLDGRARLQQPAYHRRVTARY